MKASSEAQHPNTTSTARRSRRLARTILAGSAMLAFVAASGVAAVPAGAVTTAVSARVDCIHDHVGIPSIRSTDIKVNVAATVQVYVMYPGQNTWVVIQGSDTMVLVEAAYSFPSPYVWVWRSSGQVATGYNVPSWVPYGTIYAFKYTVHDYNSNTNAQAWALNSSGGYYCKK